MNKKLFFGLLSLAFFYFTFLHKSRELPLSVKEKGVAVVDEIKTLNVLGYKPYNPGVIELDDGYLLVAREKAESFFHYLWLKAMNERKNVIKCVELDQNFNEKAKAQLLLPSKDLGLSNVTDPRLFKHEGALYMIFSHHVHGGAEQVVALLEKGDQWRITKVTPLFYDDGKKHVEERSLTPGMEKNWMPFSHDGKLYVIYLLDPDRVILEVNLETGECKKVQSVAGLNDEFKPMRGGSPPFYDDELGSFLALYHIAFPGRYSYTNLKRNVYIGGAYAFEGKAPFDLTKVSSGPFYQEDLYKGRQKIIFPTALIKKDDHYLMFYGEDDCSIKVAKINKERLFESMKDVK